MDLIPEKGWLVEKSAEATKNHGLELTVGPPSGDWTISKEKSNETSLSFAHFSSDPCLKTPVLKYPLNQPRMASFVHLEPVHQQIQGGGHVTVVKESSQRCNNNNRAGEDLRSAETKKGFSPAPYVTRVSVAIIVRYHCNFQSRGIVAKNMASFFSLTHTSSSQEPRTQGSIETRTMVVRNDVIFKFNNRTAPPVVGWPPVRSFRKNLTNATSSKPASESLNTELTKTSGQNPNEDSPKSSLFVKINMDGVPIGRKVDLKAHDSYEKLSIAVDELFTGLVAAQRESCGVGIKYEDKGGNGTRGHLLHQNGEYTLVYEDNEGDRMLVGDVPWHMFVSTVRRLRVLKSSQLPILSHNGESKQGRLSTE